MRLPRPGGTLNLGELLWGGPREPETASESWAGVREPTRPEATRLSPGPQLQTEGLTALDRPRPGWLGPSPQAPRKHGGQPGLEVGPLSC